MIEQIIQDLEQKGWSYQKGLLQPLTLKNFSPHFLSDFNPAQVGSNGARKRVEEIRGDWTKWIDPMAPLPESTPVLQFLDELKVALNRRFFFGLKEFECHLAKYPAGAFYKKHLDRFEQGSSRVVSFIFYLNESWSSEDGGELVLYHKDGTQLESFLPLPGAFVCFLSEDFPHEVRASKKERRSLTGWMHNKLLT